MKKKNKTIKAEDMHELILNMPIVEYYKLFQLMFTYIINFIYEAEKITQKYNEKFKGGKDE